MRLAKRFTLSQPTLEDPLAVGVFILHDAEPARRDLARSVIVETLRGGPVRVLGWRAVPTRNEVLPANARACRPEIDQLLLGVAPGQEELALEQWLYRRRLELRHRLASKAALETLVEPAIHALKKM